MKIQNLIELINHKLADELLSPTQLINHMDSVIDDINTQLNSTFPTFTEAMLAQGGLLANVDYTAIPDKYLRSVVVVGAATKYYEIDEEGNPTAQTFAQDYRQQLFYMLRDYSFSIPEEYRASNTQGVLSLNNADLNTPGLSLDTNLIF
jgi:hypothetical protein